MNNENNLQNNNNNNLGPISNTEINVSNALNSGVPENNQNVIMPEFNNNQFDNNQTINEPVTQIDNSEKMSKVQENNQILYDTTNNINDKPVLKKQKKTTIKINSELSFVIVLALILLVAIFIMPSIMDLFY